MTFPAVLSDVSTLEDPTRLSRPGRDGEPAWLVDARREALDWVVENGFPTRKHEDWRYIGLGPILELAFSPLARDDIAVAEQDLAASLVEELGGPRLVLVNGRFAPHLSRLSGLPTGVAVRPIAAALRADAPELRGLWTPSDGRWGDGFAALNTALAVDGAYVEVAEGVLLDVPIEIVYLSAGGDHPVMAHPRTVIRVGAASRATLVETYIAANGGISLTNCRTQVVLDEAAAVEHYRFQADGVDAYHLSSVEVHPGRRSRFASHLLATGSRLARHELRAVMAAEGAAVDLDGLYLAHGEQCHDNPVRVEHAAPNCVSHQEFRGIVDGAGHGIFNGHVIVHAAAVGTDAHQANKNLLLSDRAEVDTRPRLEIFADDVACTHGATVGQLDPDAMFYLRSRGIPGARARALLIAGFAGEVLTRFRAGPMRERAERLVAEYLGTEGAVLMGGQRQ